jgi:serine/threonine protein kinase
MLGLHAQGEIIADRYQIVTTLGQGSMGTTYAAVDHQTSQRVALKVVSLRQTTEWKMLELFEREARVLATLNHPGIPQYLDYFDLDTPDDRRFYLVQELVEGESLLAKRERGWQPSEDEVKAIALQTLDILAYLNGLNPPVIHRDIKPENLIQTPDGRIVLVDFGAVQEAYRATISRGGTFVGTLGYMPPEQFRCQTVAASDLYSLGATLVFLLSGKSPADLPQVRMKLDFQAEITVSRPFAAWLETSLEPAIEDRFASAIAAQEALRANLPLKLNPEQIAPQPADSQIILSKSPHNTTIHIPSGTWWHKKRFTLLVVNCVWTAIALPTISLLVAIAIVVALDPAETVVTRIVATVMMGIPIVVMAAISGLLWQGVRTVKGDRTTLHITPQTTRLTYRFLPLQSTLMGATSDISLRYDPDRYNYIELRYAGNNEPITRSVWGLTRPLRQPQIYRFGQALTPEERDWLAGELKSLFVMQPVALHPTPASPPDSLLPHSRVQLRRDADTLMIQVPATYSVLQAGGVAIAVVIGMCLVFPIGIIALIVLCIVRASVFWSVGGDFQLKITADRYDLRWSYFGWNHYLTGKTADIHKVALCPTGITVNNRPVYTCGLVKDHNTILFGTWLREDERTALVEVINDYLQTQRS